MVFEAVSALLFSFQQMHSRMMMPAFIHDVPRRDSFDHSGCNRLRGTTPETHASSIFDEPEKNLGFGSSSTFQIQNPSIFNDESSEWKEEILSTRPDEPYLYEFPSAVSAVYRVIPLIIRVLLGAISTITAARFCRTSNTIYSTLQMASAPFHSPISSPKRILQFILTTFAAYFTLSSVTKEALYAPSRVDTATLLLNKWFPSPLSKYSIVSTAIPPMLNDKIVSLNNIGPMGVHFLEYSGSSDSETPDKYNFDAIHFNHGFGASSLSWLPAIPSIVDKLGARVGIAHDAPGFGFTDRPAASGRKGGLVPYSASGSASLGNALLLNRMNDADAGATPGNSSHVQNDDKTCDATDIQQKKVALIGHSMGCATTLRMALTLPKDVQKVVVLVAPALVGKFPSDDSPVNSSETKSIIQSQPSKVRNFVQVFIAALRRVILDPILMYILKRVVGRPNFWSNGLRLAWGDPNRLTSNDAIRFQWPSIGRGWESGLLAFTRSRVTSTCSYDGGEIQLLQDVLRMPNTSVTIVHGSNDCVVPVSMTRKIVDYFKDKITFMEMKGLGHDPFEEDVKNFVEIIGSLQ